MIFDLFGTLIGTLTTKDYARVLSQMAAVLEVPADDFRRMWGESIRDRMNGRLGGMHGNIEHVCLSLDAHPTQTEISVAAEIRRDMTRRALEPKWDAVSTLTQLREMGYRVGLISDCTAEVPDLWSETPFAPLVESPVFSCSVGLTKPNPRIYHLASERLGVPPGECVYVADGCSGELAGALEVGMRPVLVAGPQTDIAGTDQSEARSWRGESMTDLGEIVHLIGAPKWNWTSTGHP